MIFIKGYETENEEEAVRIVARLSAQHEYDNEDGQILIFVAEMEDGREEVKTCAPSKTYTEDEIAELYSANPCLPLYSEIAHGLRASGCRKLIVIKDSVSENPDFYFQEDMETMMLSWMYAACRDNGIELFDFITVSPNHETFKTDGRLSFSHRKCGHLR